MRAKTIYFLTAVVWPSITFGITGLADIELVPNPPPPYFGGETLTVDVWLHSNDVTSDDLRWVQLDIRPVPTPVRWIADGAFTQAGSSNALRIAELKNGQWAPMGAVGSGARQAVLAIAQFDEGSGQAKMVVVFRVLRRSASRRESRAFFGSSHGQSDVVGPRSMRQRE